MAHKITFNQSRDTVFDCGGVFTTASGCSPHNPDEARVVIRNCDIDSVKQEVDDEIARLASEGDSNALLAFVESTFTLIGRARECSFQLT
jgi:hypothetical protein